MGEREWMILYHFLYEVSYFLTCESLATGFSVYIGAEIETMLNSINVNVIH